MKNMKEQLFSIGEQIGGKLVNGIGEASIRMGEQSRGRCICICFYEPKVPIELLKEDIEE